MHGRTVPVSDVAPLMRPVMRRVGLMLLWVAVGAPVQAGENWTSFQNGGNVSFPNSRHRHTPSLQWTAAIPGYGQSSPVVWNGTIFVTSVSGANKETCHVSAYRLSDGVQQWQHDLPNASLQESTNYVSKAAPTPVAGEQGVYCFFEGGNVLALAHSGRVRWERNLVDEFGPIDARHGIGSSLEQTDQTLFVWVERNTDPYLLCLDKQTGRTLWKAPGLGATSWASPRLVPVEGGVHLVLSGVGLLAGLDPQTGERLWTFDAITGNSTPTPIPLKEGEFLIGATVGRGESSSGSAAASNGVISVRKRGDREWEVGYVWKAQRATSSFGSPIVHAGHAYFVNASGVLYCLEAATGAERYAQRVAGSVWATPIALGDRIWLFGKEGRVQSIEAGESFRSLGEIDLFDGPSGGTNEGASESEARPTLYAAVVVGESMLLRSGDKLFCLRP